MNSWIGKLVFVLGAVVAYAIRAPHNKVNRSLKVVETRRSTRERLLMFLGRTSDFTLPLLSFTPLLIFADYPLYPSVFFVGTFSTGLGVWLFHRSHADLGKNWSPTLEVREEHQLITKGVYRSIRHPMYSSILLRGIGQACLLANWLAGPSLLIAFSLMFSSRLKTEEQMMLDRFGLEYETYRERTKRIIPGLW